MSSYSKNIKLYISLLIIFLGLFVFPSCSQNVPDITYTDYSIVFSYKDKESKPDARLSLFLQNQSDVRRCERIVLYSTKSEYKWETSHIKKIAAGDYQWAGNVNFVVPEGEKIPEGIYEITYINADESEGKTTVNVFYDEKIYDYSASQLLDNKANDGSVNLAIFNKDRVLLYFGEKTEDLRTKGDIFNTYPEASFYQDIWLSYDKTVICILPENKL